MASPKELHFHSVQVFFCPLFSEERLKESALIHILIQCHDSRASRCRLLAVVWLTEDHRTTQGDNWDTPKYPGEHNDKTVVFFKIKWLFFSLGKWHVLVTCRLLNINTAGCCVCCDPVWKGWACRHTYHSLVALLWATCQHSEVYKIFRTLFAFGSLMRWIQVEVIIPVKRMQRG